jgi:hypothetical protein
MIFIVKAPCCGAVPHATDSTPGLEAGRRGDKKFRLPERLREGRYFPRVEYCRCLAVVPGGRVEWGTAPQQGAC